ncbi:LOW QUALITY PROTEIN: DDB1- and CUL4-associated factor 11 [Phalacrocorax carbo]|uniref:LOW QUALITY PROTEIN: DDB1- and CUL4-associated factor 11 n=1 Tax=Phalacrocorax carbo TaxID=9209 RepID=UPI00311914C7
MGSHSSSSSGGGGEGRGGRGAGGRRPSPPPPPPRGEPRRGEGEGEGEGEEEEEDDDVDLAQVLAYLLGRDGAAQGGARAGPGDPPDSDEEPWDGGGADSDPAPAPPPPDTRGLAGHELRLQLELALGRGAGPGPTEESLPRLLRQREWGRCRNGSFSPGEKTRLGSHFLPNHVTFADSYPKKAFCGVFSDDGSVFVSASQDQTLRFYESRPGGEGLRLFRASRARDVGWSVLDVAFTPDGAHCLYSSWSDYIHVYDIYGDGDNHTALDLRPEEHRFAVFSLAVGPGGREVVGGANDGCLYVYDRELQRRVLRVAAHEDDVNAVALAGEGQLLLSGGDDGVCRAWDRRSLGEGRPRPVGLLAGHRDGITFLHPRGDGRYLVTNSKDQTAKLWDLRRPAGPGGLAAARRAVARQSWDYRWQRAPRRGEGAGALPGDTSLVTFRGHAVLQTLLRARLSPGGGLFLGAGSAEGAVLVYDVLTGAGRAAADQITGPVCGTSAGTRTGGCWPAPRGTAASAFGPIGSRRTRTWTGAAPPPPNKALRPPTAVLGSPLFPKAHALVLAALVGLEPGLRARADPHSLLASPHNLLRRERLVASAGGWTSLFLGALLVAALPLVRPGGAALGRALGRWLVGVAMARSAPRFFALLEAVTGRCVSPAPLGLLLLPHGDPRSCRANGHRWEGVRRLPPGLCLGSLRPGIGRGSLGFGAAPVPAAQGVGQEGGASLAEAGP